MPSSLASWRRIGSVFVDIKIPSLEDYLSTRFDTSSSKYICEYCGFVAKNAAAKSKLLVHNITLENSPISGEDSVIVSEDAAPIVLETSKIL